MVKPTEDESLKRITKQIDNTLEVSDVLSGRKNIGGKLGTKLKQKQEDEKDIVKGKEARKKKFKQFDNWCERTEEVVNYKGRKDIKIRRAAVVGDDKNKII